MTSGPGWIGRLAAHADGAPESLALRDPRGPETSYGELLAQLERLRATLAEAGVGPGEAVALYLPSGPDLLRAFVATASLGAIATPLAPSLTVHELPRMLELADPVAAVTTTALRAELAPLLEPLAGLRTVVLCDADGSDAGDGAVGVGAARSPLEEPAPETPVGCHFTYKGLGYPLGALHRYGAFSYGADALAAAFPPVGDDANLVVLPFHQVYGLVSSVVAPLSRGCPLVMPRRFSPRRLLGLIASERIRYACLVPALLPFLVRAAREEDAPKVRPDLCLLSGGSLLDAELAGELADALGVEPYQGYGLTETLPIVANTPRQNVRGALGVPLGPEVELAIRDADGAPTPAGFAGEVHVRGPTVMAGYRHLPRETARFLRDGWLRTGDLAHRDEAGVLHFLGRREPFAKISGQMVDLVEVEQVLRRHRGVADVCAFAGDGRGGQDELCAAVTLVGESDVRLGELFALARERLSPHKVPKRIKIYRTRYERLEATF